MQKNWTILGEVILSKSRRKSNSGPRGTMNVFVHGTKLRAE